MEDLYKNIKKFRKARGLTQSELSQKMGYSDRSMIARIEAGDVDITHSKIIAFAEALDVSPMVLMGWEEYNESNDRIIQYAKKLAEMVGDSK